MNLLLHGNFKRSIEPHKFDKIRPKMLQRELEIDTKKLDETPVQLWEWIRNIDVHTFHVELISNRSIIM
jgi:hypothetical protein